MLDLRGYYDETGHSADPNARLCGVAGAISTADKWEECELAWRATLERFEVRQFHMIKPGDAEIKRGGVLLWKVMLRRARGPLKKEGFVESEKGKSWKITARGRRAAEAPVEVEGRRAASETTP